MFSRYYCDFYCGKNYPLKINAFRADGRDFVNSRIYVSEDKCELLVWLLRCSHVESDSRERDEIQFMSEKNLCAPTMGRSVCVAHSMECYPKCWTTGSAPFNHQRHISLLYQPASLKARLSDLHTPYSVHEIQLNSSTPASVRNPRIQKRNSGRRAHACRTRHFYK